MRHKGTFVRLVFGLVGAALLTVLAPTAEAAQPAGSMDRSFDGDGLIKFGLGHEPIGVGWSAVATDSQGRRLVVADGADMDVGSSDSHTKLFVARLLPDGELDPTFGTGGVFKLEPSSPGAPPELFSSQEFPSVAVDAADRVLVSAVNRGEEWNSILLRLTASGTLDPSFDGNGIKSVDGSIADIATLGEKPVLAVNTVETEIQRLTATGSLDGTFGGGDGRLSPSERPGADTINQLTLRPGGGIWLVGAPEGAAVEVIRLGGSGSPDTTFSGDGLFSFDPRQSADQYLVVSDASVADDGGLLITGRDDIDLSRSWVAKVDASDGLDAGFGEEGISALPQGLIVAAVGAAPDGGASVAGQYANDPYRSPVAVARLDGNGDPVGSYGEEGVATLDLGAHYNPYFPLEAEFDADGRVLLTGPDQGTAANVLLDGEGQADESFGGEGQVRLAPAGNAPSIDNGEDVLVDSADRVTVIGTTSATASPTSPPTTDVFAVRYLPSGAVDGSFGEGGYSRLDFGPGTYVTGAAFDSAGRIVVGGGVDAEAGLEPLSDVGGPTNDSDDRGLFAARLTPAGALDESFGAGGVRRLNLAEDDYLKSESAVGFGLVGDAVVLTGIAPGAFGGPDFPAVVKLDPEGGIDTAFGEGGLLLAQEHPDLVFSEPEDLGDDRMMVRLSSQEPGTTPRLIGLGPDGSPAAQFGTDGTLTPPSPVDHLGVAEPDPAGGLVLAGSTVAGDPVLARVNMDGELDPSFGGGDGFTVSAHPADDFFGASEIAIDDDQIALRGSSQYNGFAFSRFSRAGVLDTSFGEWEPGYALGYVGGEFNRSTGFALDGQGRIVAAGWLLTSVFARDIRDAAVLRLRSDALPRFRLTVAKAGSGNGTVVGSSHSGSIQCGSVCSAEIDQGDVVALTASANAGSEFVGWSGACTHTGRQCNVPMDAARSVTARFDAVVPPRTPPRPTITSVKVSKSRTATIAFRSSAPPPVEFECYLDHGDPYPCASPVILKKLKPGRHSFGVYSPSESGSSPAAETTFKVKKKRKKKKKKGGKGGK